MAVSDGRYEREYAMEHAQGTDGKLFRFDGGFHTALERACNDEIDPMPRCTPNDLRRTFAHWLRDQGVPIELIAPAMGHSDTRMVERVYGRIPTDVLAARMACVTWHSYGTDSSIFTGFIGHIGRK